MDGSVRTAQRLVDATRPDATQPDAARIDALLTSAPHRLVADFIGESRLSADLAECVDRIGQIVAAEPMVVSDALREVATRGKRLRPLLVLATASAADGEQNPTVRDRAVRGGVVVELLHLASLVHDDVMDEATTRHGATSVNVRTGNIRAVLAGDYLLGQGLCAGCDLGQSEGALAAQTFVRLCEGQARESATLFDPERTESAYFGAITGKTGALFQAACQLGAMAAGLSPKSTAALADYGLRLGITFQLVDDLLDITAPAHALGKPAGHDIVEGVYTLPVLRAMEEHPRLRHVLRRPDREDAAQEALGIVRNSDAIAAVRRETARWSDRAVAALSEARPDIDRAGVAMLAELASTLAARRY